MRSQKRKRHSVTRGPQRLKLEVPSPFRWIGRSSAINPALAWTPSRLFGACWPGSAWHRAALAASEPGACRQWLDCRRRAHRGGFEVRPAGDVAQPVYRALVASGKRRDGHGAIRSLARISAWDNSRRSRGNPGRRGAPVTRLFQWEQKQEVYFVVDNRGIGADARSGGGPSAISSRRGGGVCWICRGNGAGRATVALRNWATNLGWSPTR